MKFFRVSLGIFVCVITVVIAALGYQAFGTISAVRADAQAGLLIISKTNATLDRINAPCIGFHGSVTCGTLAQIDQSVKNIGAMAAQSQQQVRQSADVIAGIQRSLVGISQDVHSEMAALVKTTDAATGLLTAGTQTVGILNDPHTGVAPLLASTSAAVAHTDAAVVTITPQISHAITVGTGILQDGKDEADKLVHPAVVKLTRKAAVEAFFWKLSAFVPRIF